mmetsp:Transcript_19512/g.47870  ORF Transcript_19512/g.47870 Transcript_19512/m.47870 type:complete len:147 (+) Transcript_19512:731-1171(+)
MRYKSRGCKIAPAKMGVESDALHMHVDQDKKASTVMVVSLGDDVEMLFDGSTGCKRLEACTTYIEARNGAGGSPKPFADLQDVWRKCECGTCTSLTLRSGDILLFDGLPSKHIAHGVRGTSPNKAPVSLPGWLQKCRVSLQYRQLN